MSVPLIGFDIVNAPSNTIFSGIFQQKKNISNSLAKGKSFFSNSNDLSRNNFVCEKFKNLTLDIVDWNFSEARHLVGQMIILHEALTHM